MPKKNPPNIYTGVYCPSNPPINYGDSKVYWVDWDWSRLSSGRRNEGPSYCVMMLVFGYDCDD
jgi:hypothetical protein